jgi:hypothetical protein
MKLIFYLLKNKKYTYMSKLIKIPQQNLIYKENLFICNGVGGRGFVFAPYMAKLLVKSIVEKKEIDKRVNPDRLFLKWCRKLNSNL